MTVSFLPESIEARLADLAALPHNWNSYGAEPITTFAIEEARRLLSTCEPADLAQVAIVPTSIGGIQLEWHERAHDVEYDIPPEPTRQRSVSIEAPDLPDPAAFLGMVR